MRGVSICTKQRRKPPNAPGWTDKRNGVRPTDCGKPLSPPPQIQGRWGKQLRQTNMSLTPEKTGMSPETPLFPAGVTGNRTQTGPDTPRHRPQHWPGRGNTLGSPERASWRPAGFAQGLRPGLQDRVCSARLAPVRPGHGGRRHRRGKQKRKEGTPRPRTPASCSRRRRPTCPLWAGSLGAGVRASRAGRPQDLAPSALRAHTFLLLSGKPAPEGRGPGCRRRVPGATRLGVRVPACGVSPFTTAITDTAPTYAGSHRVVCGGIGEPGRGRREGTVHTCPGSPSDTCSHVHGPGTRTRWTSRQQRANVAASRTGTRPELAGPSTEDRLAAW